MRPGFSVALSLALVLLATHAQPIQSGALLQNGSFEDGLNGWQSAGSALSLVSAPVDHGLLAAKMVVADGREVGEAVHAVELVPGGGYRLIGATLLDDSDIEWFVLGLRWQTSGGSEISRRSQEIRTTEGQYQEIVVTQVQVPCDLHSARVFLSLSKWSVNSFAEAFIDDVRLELVDQAPCPSPTSPPTSVPPTFPPGGPPGATATPRPGETATPGIGALRNGGFEESEGGVPVAWRDHGGALTQVSSPVHGGRFAGAFFSASDSTKWAYQTVAVTPLSWYEFAAHVYLNDPDVEAAFLRVSWYVAADGSGSAVDDVDSIAVLETSFAGYRRLTTGSVQAPPGVRSANVRILLRPRSSAGAVIYIDDASWRAAAPAPGNPAGDGDSDASSGDVGGSGGSYSSSVRGVARGPVNALGTPYPTPVLVRGENALGTGVSSGEGAPWWMWGLVAAGGALAVGVGGWGWRWKRH